MASIPTMRPQAKRHSPITRRSLPGALTSCFFAFLPFLVFFPLFSSFFAPEDVTWILTLALARSTASSTTCSILASAEGLCWEAGCFFRFSSPKILMNMRIKATGHSPSANSTMMIGQLYQPLLSGFFWGGLRTGGRCSPASLWLYSSITVPLSSSAWSCFLSHPPDRCCPGGP